MTEKLKAISIGYRRSSHETESSDPVDIGCAIPDNEIGIVSGETALASIKMKVPDLVLLGVMMPGLDGF